MDIRYIFCNFATVINKIDMKKQLCVLWFLALVSLNLFAQTPFVGEWITVDDKTGNEMSVVSIYQTDNGKYYGKIIDLLVGSDDELCTACTGEDHNKPVIGLVIVRDMDLKNGELRGGKVLDPDNGKLYYCKMSIDKEGRLILRGSLDKAGLLGRSQTWLPKR